MTVLRMPKMFGGSDVPNTMPAPSGIGYGPPTTEEVENLATRLRERTPDEMERLRLCELHASILLCNDGIKHHSQEVMRITDERAAAQDELKNIMARLGIVTQ